MRKKSPPAASGSARRNSSIADCCDLKYSRRRYRPRSRAKNAAIRPRSRTATSSRRRDTVRAALGRARERAVRTRPRRLLDVVPGAGGDALAVGKTRRRAGRPDAVEPGEPRVVVVAHGHGFDEDRAEPRAIERLH